jgi:hypothetical protein
LDETEINELAGCGLAVSVLQSRAGRVARMSLATDLNLYMTFGMPEYGKGDGFAELHLPTRRFRRFSDELPSTNVLTTHCAGSTVLLGTDRGPYVYRPRKQHFELLPQSSEAVFEIASSIDGEGLWLGGRQWVEHRRSDASIERRYPVDALLIVQRIIDAGRFLVCSSDTRRGAVVLDKASGAVSEPLTSGYVRALYSRPGAIVAIGNEVIMISSETGAVLSRQALNTLHLAGAHWNQIDVAGTIDGLRLMGARESLSEAEMFKRLLAKLGTAGFDRAMADGALFDVIRSEFAKTIQLRSLGEVPSCLATPEGLFVGTASDLYSITTTAGAA